MDSWKNALTGLGTSRDKGTHANFAARPLLTVETLDALYHHSDLAATICETVPQEGTRQGFDLSIEDGDEKETEIRGRMDDLAALPTLTEAAVWGNVYGAAAVWVGADDGLDPSEPLNEANIREIQFLKTLTRRELDPARVNQDPLSIGFGEIETYRIVAHRTPTARAPQIQAEIHASRLIFFRGARTGPYAMSRNHGWSHSKLQKVDEALRQFETSWQGAAHLMQDLAQGKYKVKDLLEIIESEGGKEALEKRMEVIDMGRSVARSMILDADSEDFDRVATPLTGAPDLLDRFMHRLAAAARMPVAVLLGRSPAGLNATGESDIRWFYDSIKVWQSDELQPKLERLIRLIMLEGRREEPGSWSISFPSLTQPTEKERAETRKLAAETDKIYVESGVLLPEEIAVSRFAPEGWSMDTVIDLEDRRAMLEEDRQPTPTDPATEGTPVPAPAQSEPDDAKAVDPKASLNGAQVTSMVEIVQSVARGELPRGSGVAMIQSAFPLSRQQAEQIMGTVGAGFEPRQQEQPDPPPVPQPPTPPGLEDEEPEGS